MLLLAWPTIFPLVAHSVRFYYYALAHIPAGGANEGGKMEKLNPSRQLRPQQWPQPPRCQDYQLGQG